MRTLVSMVAGLALGLGACRGGADGRESVPAARGAPPEQQDTTPASTDSNHSTAPDTTPPRIIVHDVHTGPHGMAAQVRWLLSPDQRALVVVEDPVGTEAEPVPDGFLYASEATGVIVQVDGVWDVAPSPDWTRLAFGRAYVFRSGEADSIPAREWQRFFRWLPEDVAEPTTTAMRQRAESYSFPASGMSYARAIGIAQVLDLRRLSAGRAAVAVAPSVRLEGWRVRWTASGDTLAVGSAPRMVQDDAEASRWTLVRTRPVGSYRDSLGVAGPAVRLVEPSWIEGPTIDVSIEIDMARERRVPSLGATVRSAKGRIRLEREGRMLDVGPGAALAATRDGRFIAALAPVPNAGEFDHKLKVVLYEVVP